MLVSCPSTKRSMKESIGSQNFVAENVSGFLVSIYSTVLEWLNSFLFDFCSRKGFINLDVLRVLLISDNLNFESTKGYFLSFKSPWRKKEFLICSFTPSADCNDVMPSSDLRSNSTKAVLLRASITWSKSLFLLELIGFC